HGKKRLNDLAQNFDLVLSIYPFESELLEKHLIPSIYIGNPLKENMNSFSTQGKFFELIKLNEQESLIALFPGSRLQEIRKHIPTQLEIAVKLKTKYPHLIFALSCAHSDLLPTIEKYVQTSPLRLNKDIWIIPSTYTHELMKNCRLALSKSGTVTLELALHKTPTVVHYQASFLNYFIAKHIIKLRLSYFCIVNILTNQRVFHEFIGKEAYITQIYKEMDQLLCDPQSYDKVIADCQMIRDVLGEKSSHLEAAKAIEALF
ncbi:MAG: lipid-A-disaccharide synthase, partial [Parachlamydiaceae bacterium]|nr:lipid-A-disaccharide synthase [Parachlamydiaceae bacterium]